MVSICDFSEAFSLNGTIYKSQTSTQKAKSERST